jgi:hypothetical protein
VHVRVTFFSLPIFQNLVLFPRTRHWFINRDFQTGPTDAETITENADFEILHVYAV